MALHDQPLDPRILPLDPVGNKLALAFKQRTAPVARLGFVAPAERSAAWDVVKVEAIRQNTLAYGIREAGYAYGLDPSDPTSVLTTHGQAWATWLTPQKVNPSWNPYTHILDTWDEERQTRLMSFIRSGEFEEYADPERLEHRAAKLERELDELELVANGPFWAAMLGAGIGAVLDPLSWIPMIGPLSKLRGAQRTLALVTAQSTVPELGLHALQDLRTAEESFFAIGAGALVFGGGHLLIKGVPKGFRVFLDQRKHNQFKKTLDEPEKQPIGVRDADGNVDEIDPQTGVVRQTGDSVGAARVDPDASLPKEGLTSLTGEGKIGKKVAETVQLAKFATIAGRALARSSPVARVLLMQMMDLGGQLTQAAKIGVAVGARGAEDIKGVFEVYKSEMFARGDRTLNKLNRQLGEMGQKRALILGVVSPTKFGDYTKLALHNDITDADMSEWVGLFGEKGAKLVEKAAKENAKIIEKTLNVFRDRLVDLGKLHDPARLTKLQGDLVVAREALETAKLQAVKPTTGEGAVDLDDTLGALREKRDRIRADMFAEEGLPTIEEGRSGLARLWDAQGILGNTNAARGYFLRILADEPPEEWLLAGFEMTTKDFKALGAVDDFNGITRQDVLETWAEGAEHYNETLASAAFDAARRNLRTAKMEWNDARGTFTETVQGLDRAGISKAKRETGAFHTRVTTARETARKTRTELKAERARDRQADLTGTPRAQTPSQAAGEYAGAISPSALRELRDAGTPRTALSGVRTTPGTVKQVAAIKSRRQALEEQLQIDEKAVTKAEYSAKIMQSKLDDLLVEHKVWKQAKKIAKTARAQAKGAKIEASDVVKQARKALKDAGEATTLAEYVDDLVQTLMDNRKLPVPIMNGIVAETGRVKARKLPELTKAQRHEAESLGILRTELSDILHNQMDQLAGYIGLHEGMSIGRFGRFKTWGDMMKTVQDDYADLATKAGEAGDTAAARGFGTELKAVMEDFESLKHRLLGTRRIDSRAPALTWAAAKVRQFITVRFIAGFGLTSMTDMGTLHFITGGIGRLLMNEGIVAGKLMYRLWKNNEDVDKFLALVSSAEMGAQGIRMARTTGIEDTFGHGGLGARGTVLNKATSAVNKAGEWMVETGNILGGMRTWNRFWKLTVALWRNNKLHDLMPDYDKILARARAGDEVAQKQIEKLSSIGIDETAARGILEQMKLHSFRDETSRMWNPNLEEWYKTPGGRRAAEDLMIAIERDVKRGVITPGIGDTGRILDKDEAKVLFQFQAFALAFTNKFLVPASQDLRAGEMEAIMAMVHMLWTGTVVMTGKDIINGRDWRARYTKEAWPDTVRQIIDRTGLMAYMSPYVSAATKLAGVGGADRYRRNNWAQDMMGPAAGLAGDIGKAGPVFADALTGRGEMDQVMKQLEILTPYKTLFSILKRMEEIDSP